jgi:hypothetical protein
LNKRIAARARASVICRLHTCRFSFVSSGSDPLLAQQESRLFTSSKSKRKRP